MTDDEAVDTAGTRADALARFLVTRRAPHYPWAPGFADLLDHVTRLSGVSDERFERTESSAGIPILSIGRPISTRVAASAATDAMASAPTIPPDTTEPDSDDVGHEALSRAQSATDGADPGQPLPRDVAARLAHVMGPGTESMRVHHDRHADAVARSRDADAVTMGRDVYFRQGGYRPRDPDGFALLVHEATHVIESLLPGAAWRRATGTAGEEKRALTRERTVATAAAAHVSPSSPSTPVPSPRELTISSPATALPTATAGADHRSRAVGATISPQPMRAETGRDLAAEVASPDFDKLRRAVVDEVKRLLRTEFERGG